MQVCANQAKYPNCGDILKHILPTFDRNIRGVNVNNIKYGKKIYDRDNPHLKTE
jgi:hypothetical protein